MCSLSQRVGCIERMRNAPSPDDADGRRVRRVRALVGSASPAIKVGCIKRSGCTIPTGGGVYGRFGEVALNSMRGEGAFREAQCTLRPLAD